MVVINLSGRGDKDMGTVAEALGITLAQAPAPDTGQARV
jgi:tryptophan synthase beta subunit